MVLMVVVVVVVLMTIMIMMMMVKVGLIAGSGKNRRGQTTKSSLTDHHYCHCPPHHNHYEY